MTAFNPQGCSDSTKLINVVKVIKGGHILIPNAFSPGSTAAGGSCSSSGDGKDDVFLPLTRGLVEFELLAFNR